MDAAVTGYLSDPDGIFGIKENKKSVQKTFLCGKDVFAQFLTGFNKSQMLRQIAAWHGAVMGV